MLENRSFDHIFGFRQNVNGLFDYREKLSLALDYLNNLGIVSVGRNAEFEYINMDEAIRRGEAAARALESAA